jgi:hypothetical protein
MRESDISSNATSQNLSFLCIARNKLPNNFANSATASRSLWQTPLQHSAHESDPERVIFDGVAGQTTAISIRRLPGSEYARELSEKMIVKCLLNSCIINLP